MNRGGSRADDGFTIVETLIVLAVTSALFVSAMLLVAGRQAKTEFQVGSRRIEQLVRSQINYVENGYYERNSNFTCSSSGGVTITPGGSAGQGENGSCVLAGSAFHFAKPDVWQRMGMASPRLSGGGDINISLTNAKAIEPTTSSTTLPAGFEFAWGRWFDNTGDKGKRDNFVFLLLSDVSSAGQGTAAIQPLVLRGFAAPTTPDFDANLLSSASTPASRVELCFAGGTGKSVLVTIGGNGGVAVTSNIKEGISCGA